MAEAQSKKKIVVLGGGLSALSAVYYLTNQADWHQYYDITVYQMGWRLGGKLASGSDRAKNYRIEDTGVHFCMGFYENFFRMIRDCYVNLYKDPEFWRQHFLPEDNIVFMDYYRSQWKPWTLTPPALRRDKDPGDGLPILNLWEELLEFLQRFNQHYIDVFAQKIDAEIEAVLPDSWLRKILLQIVAFFKNLLEQLSKDLTTPEPKLTKEDPCALPDSFFVKEKNPQPSDDKISQIKTFIEHVDKFVKGIEEDIEKEAETITDEFRHAWLLLKFGLVMIRGIIEDDVLFKGFRQLDGLDFSAWLRQYGADDALIASPLVRGLYEGVFAYEDGDLQKPNIAAGVALYTMLRQFLFHNGALIYRMNDSTGISVFTPLYRELLKRGVNFQFFKRVKKLNLSDNPATPNQVDSITIEHQVLLKDGAYNPLMLGRDEHHIEYGFWPSLPIFGQIEKVQADILETASHNANTWAEVNPEYYSSPSLVAEPERTFNLKMGTDYDLILLAIPVGALPEITPGFGQVNPKWDAMTKNLKTVATQGMQLWFVPSLEEMGWSGSVRPIVATYVDPWSAWGDMYQLLTQEEKEKGIKTVIHFAAVLKDLPRQPPPSKLTGADHIRAAKYVHDEAIHWLEKYAQPLWPKATNPVNPQCVDWSKLYVFHDDWEGPKRFDDQYWGASIDPSIRYDQSLPNTLQYRMKQGESGFSNLVLSGTWTDNGLNVSLMESATMSGMMASSVITERITGTSYPGFKSIVGVMDYDYGS